MAGFYELGISCPDNESIEEIAGEFRYRALRLSNGQELSVNYYTEQQGLEWFIGIHLMVWEYNQVNSALSACDIFEEMRIKVDDILKQNAHWKYYYAVFQENAYEVIIKRNLLTELLTEEETVKRFVRLCYPGLVLNLSLAQAMGIAQWFEPFNACYCWIPNFYDALLNDLED